MGNLIWHEYARLVSLTASVYGVWAGFYGILYRKFFWDFVGGTLRDPGGLQPANGALPFITIVVDFPIVPIVAMIIGMFMVALEFPLPALKRTSIGRSIVFRIVMLLLQSVVSLIYYQGTNCALWGLIAMCCYIRAQTLGEVMEEAKANKGSGGRA